MSINHKNPIDQMTGSNYPVISDCFAIFHGANLAQAVFVSKLGLKQLSINNSQSNSVT